MRILFLALVFVSSLTSAQSISELRDALDTDDDSTRVATMGKLAATYARSNTDSAFYFGRKALQIAKEVKLRNGEASSNNALGNIHFFQSNYDSAQYYWNQCFSISTELDDSLRMAAMLNNIGMSYTYQTRYDTSLIVLFEARKLRLLLDDPKITSTVNNIGIAYQRMEDWDKALAYYQEAAELKEKYEQTLSLSNTLNNIGIVLKQLGRSKDAIPYYERSLKIAEDFNDKTKQANAHNNIAAIYHDDPDFHGHALDHYKMSIALKRDMGDRVGLFNSYSQLADLLSEMGQNEEALKYLKLAEDLNEELGQNLFTSIMLQVKSDVLWRAGRREEAFEALKESNRLKAEEMTVDRNEKIADLEAKFKTAQKQTEIERLSLEGELNETNLARLRNAQFGISAAGILLILTMVIFFYYRNKRNKAELEAQEFQLEALRKRLTDLNAAPAEIELDSSELNEKINMPLTDREFEVLRLSMEGKSNAEIGDELFISSSTVKFHLRNTYSKLGVNNRREALDYVVKTS